MSNSAPSGPAALPVAAPRLLVIAAEDSAVTFVEEFASAPGANRFAGAPGALLCLALACGFREGCGHVAARARAAPHVTRRPGSRADGAAPPRCAFFVPSGCEAAFVNALAEVVVEPRAAVTHGLVAHHQDKGALYKSTFVSQGSHSSYAVVEVALGSALSRHDLDVRQLGPQTETKLSTFQLVAKKCAKTRWCRLRACLSRG